MKKSLLLLLLCAGILTGCGNQALPAEPRETSTVSQTTSAVQAAEQSTTTTTTITEGIPEVTETCSEVISSVTTETENNTATEEIPNDTESTTTTAFVQEEEPPAVQSTTTGADDVVTIKVTTTAKTTMPTRVTTTTKPATTTKATTTTKVTTTTKATTTAPIQTTTTTTTTDGDEYYREIGRNLSHDGTDYGKAKAVYDWMRANGHGTCVNYSYQTYLICEGIGLNCYFCWTAAGIYGHTANVVKVNGIRFVLDTQGQGFLLNNDCGFTEIIDKNENHVADASIISSQRYDELFE